METPCFPPPCPQVGGCPQASQHPATTQDEFNFGERVKPAAGYRPLAYSSPEAVQTTGTVVKARSAAGAEITKIRQQSDELETTLSDLDAETMEIERHLSVCILIA
jgi:hypothetical protein